MQESESMASETRINLWQLKSQHPTLKHVYSLLENSGWYLPHFEKKGCRLKCWSEEYFQNLLENKSFKILRAHIRLPPSRIATVRRETLAAEIDKICGSIKLNISAELLPKEWLKHVLYTLNPNHELLQGQRKLKAPAARVFPKEIAEKILALPKVNKTFHSRIWQYTYEEKKIIDSQKEEEDIHHIKKKRAAQVQKITEIQSKITRSKVELAVRKAVKTESQAPILVQDSSNFETNPQGENQG